MAHLLGEYDAFAQINPALLHGNFTKKIKSKTGKTGYSKWIKNYNELVERSKEYFAKHCCSTYGGPLPIWIAVELWDFGLLSNFYQGMAIGDKERIAAKYGLHSWKTMASWLRTINHVRNIAAHHSRLWNNNLVDQPKMPEPGEIIYPIYRSLIGPDGGLPSLPRDPICKVFYFFGVLFLFRDRAQSCALIYDLKSIVTWNSSLVTPDMRAELDRAIYGVIPSKI